MNRLVIIGTLYGNMRLARLSSSLGSPSCAKCHKALRAGQVVGYNDVLRDCYCRLCANECADESRQADDWEKCRPWLA